MQRISNRLLRGIMRTKIEINKKVAKIFSELWLEKGCPATIDYGRAHDGEIDMLLEYEESDYAMVDGLLAEAINIYQEQRP